MHLYEHLHAGSHSHLLSIKAPRSHKAGMHLLSLKCMRRVSASLNCNKAETNLNWCDCSRSKSVSYLRNECKSAYLKINLALTLVAFCNDQYQS